MTFKHYGIYDSKTKALLATINVHDDDKNVLKNIKAKHLGDDRPKIGYIWDEASQKFIHPKKRAFLRYYRKMKAKCSSAVKEIRSMAR